MAYQPNATKYRRIAYQRKQGTYGGTYASGNYSRPSSGYTMAKPYYQRRRAYSPGDYGGKLSWYNKIYNFKDSYESLADYPLSTSGGGFGGQGLSLKFSSLPTYAVRSNIGDVYKIYKWKVVIISYVPTKLDATEWRAVPVGLTAMDVTLSQGQHALSVDYTDSAVVSNWGQVRTANNSISVKGIDQSLKGIIRPRLQKIAYDGGIDGGYMPGTSWCSMSDPSVQHYGFKYHWEIPGYDTGATLPPNHYRYRIINTVYYGIKNCQRSY